MGAALDALERRRVARIDFDAADRVGFTRVLGAFLPTGPGRANPANEINASVGLLRQWDGDLAGPDAELFVRHVVLRSRGGRTGERARSHNGLSDLVA